MIYILYLLGLLFSYNSIYPVYSSSDNFSRSNHYHSNVNKDINFHSNTSDLNEFMMNIPLPKSYGPISIDINNINYSSGIFIIPALNDINKPIFIAINCSHSKINVWIPDYWKGWFSPSYTYEINLINDFCKTITKL